MFYFYVHDQVNHKNWRGAGQVGTGNHRVSSYIIYLNMLYASPKIGGGGGGGGSRCFISQSHPLSHDDDDGRMF